MPVNQVDSDPTTQNTTAAAIPNTNGRVAAAGDESIPNGVGLSLISTAEGIGVGIGDGPGVGAEL